MDDTQIELRQKLNAAPPSRALTPASGFELGRRLRALRADTSEGHQSVSKIEQEIKKRVALLDQSAAIIKGSPHLAAVFAPHTAAIEAQIADLQRQAAEIRTASTERRKEMQDISVELASRRKPAISFGPHPRAKLCQLQTRS